MVSINLAGSVIGMGNLEFPFFMLNFGFFPTVIAMILTFFVMYLSCKMMIKSRDLSMKSDLSKISLFCFEKWGLISHFSILTYNAGVCVSFTLIYYDTMNRLIMEGLQLPENSI